MGLSDLPVFVLQQVKQGAVKDPWAAGAQAGSVTTGVQTVSRGFNPN
jgi:hypothetical protein